MSRTAYTTYTGWHLVEYTLAKGKTLMAQGKDLGRELKDGVIILGSNIGTAMVLSAIVTTSALDMAQN